VITLNIRYDNDKTEVCVKDTGCGISEANLEKLFSLDEHLATKGTNKEPGTGLGLILCNEFIILNKGTLRVDSEEGKGSRFCFTLPKDTPDGTPQAPRHLPGGQHINKPKHLKNGN
jgi:signal transduction histidine kinase